LNKVNRKRTIILNTAIIFGFFAIFLRLTDLMILNHKVLTERAKSQQTKAEDIQARRGNIYDRKGREFAVNVDLESLYCDAKEVVIDKGGVQELSSALGVQPAVLQAKFQPGKRFTWVDRKLSPDTAEKIRAVLHIGQKGKEDIRGFGFIPEAKRFYPQGMLASHIIGSVGLENQPLEGIELKYDKYLRSTGGKVYVERDAGGNMLFSGEDTESNGNNVILTIDEGIQYIVEKELDKAMAKWNPKSASVIVMDPFTGEILALANRPSYDLNEIGRATKSEIRDRAITDIYEPGSTFKIVIGTAALEEKVFTPESRFDVSRGSIEVGGKVVHDAHRHGVLAFREVIQKSSNVGSIMIGMRLGREKIYEYAKRYGFGEPTGIDLPGEISGWIKKPERWSATSIGAIPIGQEVAVTPLQILRAYSAIANGGYLVKPHVVSEIVSPNGRQAYAFKSPVEKRVISEKTAETFRDILKTVVEEGGTATEAAVDGNQVAGKTGTSQLVDPVTKRYSHQKYVASFVGFVPADNPKIAMIVMVREPKGAIYGGVVAGPMFKDIASQSLSYMNVPRDDSHDKNLLLVSK
jgi:cell division protein FtsI (penicillin-binding protein 3)